MRVRLEGEQRQHMVHIGAHGARASRPPGPDGGADIIDDRQARQAGAHPARHAMREVGAVDDDQRIRLRRDDGRRRLPDAPHFIQVKHRV